MGKNQVNQPGQPRPQEGQPDRDEQQVDETR